VATKVSAKKDEDEVSSLGLSDEQLKDILSKLKLCRYLDERMEALYRQGRLPGAIYSGRGQEGTHVGVAYALRKDDSLFPTHRDLSAQLTKGLDLKRVMAQYWGRIDGYLRGRDGNSHIGDWDGNRTFAVISHLPIAYPIACGAALAYKLRGEPRVAMGICGDGSTSNGRWHEALNTSAIHQLPVVWVVTTTSSRIPRRTRSSSACRRSPSAPRGTGCPACGSTRRTCSTYTASRTRRSSGRGPAAGRR